LATGTPTGTKYLRDDRTWADPGTGGGSPTSVTHNFQTGTSYTAVLSDAGKLVEQSNAAANTHTVPPNSSVAFPVGTFYHIRQGGAGQTTITAGAGVTFRSRLGTGLTSIKLGGQWAEATVTQRTANEWVVSGEITL